MNDIQLLYKIKLISATPAKCVQFDINLSPPPTKCIWYIYVYWVKAVIMHLTMMTMRMILFGCTWLRFDFKFEIQFKIPIIVILGLGGNNTLNSIISVL